MIHSYLNAIDMKYLASYRFRSYLWGLNSVFRFFFVLYHEFWHWLAAIIIQSLTGGELDSVRLEITSYPSLDTNESDGFTTSTGGMRVSYMTNERFTTSSLNKLIIFAPVIGVIVLFLISPWQSWFFYLPYIEDMWLSASDIKTLQKF